MKTNNGEKSYVLSFNECKFSCAARVRGQRFHAVLPVPCVFISFKKYDLAFIELGVRGSGAGVKNFDYSSQLYNSAYQVAAGSNPGTIVFLFFVYLFNSTTLFSEQAPWRSADK